MTIQIPEAVQWLVPIVVGADWPEGDEDALRRLAQAWEQAAAAIARSRRRRRRGAGSAQRHPG
jgi:hypothetical protein